MACFHRLGQVAGQVGDTGTATVAVIPSSPSVYHATFYQHVEGLSVAPFAARALDRGLSALLVALVRLADKKFNSNGAAAILDRSHA